MEQDFLSVTKKELFYTAVMLQLKQLVNVVYDFPADNAKFEQELNEARSSLRKKKLLTESARNGISLDFALIVCAMFCANPQKCELINSNGYYATIYEGGGVYMLLEKRSENDLAAIWYGHKEKLYQYIDMQISKKDEVIENGRA